MNEELKTLKDIKEQNDKEVNPNMTEIRVAYHGANTNFQYKLRNEGITEINRGFLN